MAKKDEYVPLTVDNISRELDGVNVLGFLHDGLSIPDRKCDEIKQRHSTQASQRRATVEYWLSVDPTPSWRRLVWALEDSEEDQAAERVKPYVEPLSDPSLTAENVSSVLKTLRYWSTVCVVLEVPPPRKELIESELSDDPQRKKAAVQWWLRFSPTASWTWLAGQLFFWEERAALRAASQYIQKEAADSSLTPTNLWRALNAVRNCLGVSGLHVHLQVPHSVKDEILRKTSDYTEQKKTLLKRWLRDHPAPSWAVVAEALYQMREHDVLKQVKKTYITDVLKPSAKKAQKEALSEDDLVDIGDVW